ncbi:glycosyltransferase family 4 protein [Alteromonas flava]|uniref:glycosyltransferase family 4 protein n=1 Tax=Alteromonas flava TaxID=2048003 RepID=UPI000C28D4D5|nr:glycosyltransferase family 4 protein [Alteromonas flava]
MRVVVIGYVWPEPNSSAAGRNMLNILSALQAQQWDVNFVCAAADSEHAVSLPQLGITTHHVAINDPAFDQLIQQLEPDIALFDRFMIEEQFSWRVRKYCPHTLCILNTEDLHALRSARHQGLKAESETINLHTDKFYREIASILRSDLTLLVSNAEKQFLQQSFAISDELLCHFPLFPTIQSNTAVPSFEQRSDLAFIGNFRHEPNWDCVRYLYTDIWPRLSQQLPHAKLRIYGAYPPPKATQLHSPRKRFLIEGWARDAQEVLANARVCLAPVRFGAGIKGKFLDAFQAGTPCVTSTVGSEGLDPTDEWPGAICTDDDAIIAAASTLYNNQERWQMAHTKALSRRVTATDLAREQQRLVEYIQQAKQDLAGRRSRNFIGAMLRHHHLASTQYMGQWIEAKSALKAAIAATKDD